MKFKTLLAILLIISNFCFAKEVTEEQDTANEDRSYFEDFANINTLLPFTYEDVDLKETTEYILVDIEMKDNKRRFVMALKGNEMEEMLVTEGSPNYTFVYTPAEEYTSTIQDLLLADNADAAIKELREHTYALIKLMDVGEGMFPVQDIVLEYIDLLISTKRLNELYSLFEFFEYDKVKEEFFNASVTLAKLLAQDGDFERTLLVLEKLNIEVNRKDLIPELMGILTIFRDAKRIEDIYRFYQRLLVIPDNKLALEAKMWSSYCDIQRGNVLTAKVIMEDFGKVDKRLPEYSLYKLIWGLIEKDAKRKTKALENFSEGIVYGKSIDDWMPELMYNTALGYCVADKYEVAVQILEEMRKFYPNNVFLALAEKDIKEKE